MDLGLQLEINVFLLAQISIFMFDLFFLLCNKYHKPYCFIGHNLRWSLNASMHIKRELLQYIEPLIMKCGH